MAAELSSIPVSNSKRLDGIDLLRGLAIFLVLLDHVHIRLALAKVAYARPQLAHFIAGNGEPGVQIFFAVSGFLITSISLRRWSPLSGSESATSTRFVSPGSRHSSFYFLRSCAVFITRTFRITS